MLEDSDYSFDEIIPEATKTIRDTIPNTYEEATECFINQIAESLIEHGVSSRVIFYAFKEAAQSNKGNWLEIIALRTIVNNSGLNCR